MITLATGYNRTSLNALPRLFNRELPWNYAIYSKNKTLKVRKVNHIKIENTVMNDIEERFRYRQKLDVNDPKALEYMNNHIKKTKDKEPDYFIRKCFERVICGNEMKDLMITDFQFMNEMEFLKKKERPLTTIRVISHVENHVATSDNIDNLTTDFLFLPLGDHEIMFKKTIKKFPQYRSFALNKNTYFCV